MVFIKDIRVSGGETVVTAVGDDGTSKVWGVRSSGKENQWAEWGCTSGIAVPGIGAGYGMYYETYLGKLDTSTCLFSPSTSETDTAWYSGKGGFPDVVSELDESYAKTNGPGQTNDGVAKAWKGRLQYGSDVGSPQFLKNSSTGSPDFSSSTAFGSLLQGLVDDGNVESAYYTRIYFMPADTPAVSSDKELVSQTLNSDGTSTLTYEMTLVNNGEELSTSGWSFTDVPTTDGTVTLTYSGPSKLTQKTSPAATWTDAMSGAAYSAADDTSKYYVSKTSTGFSVSALPVGVKLVFRASYKSSGPLVASASNSFTGPGTPDGRQHYSVEVDKVRVSAPSASGTAMSGDSRVRPGEAIYYKVTAKNTSKNKSGTAIALPATETTAGTVVDEAVRGLTLTKASPASGSGTATLDTTANAITWTLGYMAAGATKTMYVTGTVTDEGVSAEASEAADTVNKAYAQGDPPSVKVVSTPHAPDLQVNKVLVSYDTSTGAALYRIYVANESDKDYVAAPVSDTLTNATVTSVVATGATLSSAPPSGATGSLSMVLSKVPAKTTKTAVTDSRNPAGWTSSVYITVNATASSTSQAFSNAASPGKASHTLAKTRVDADGSTSARPAGETLAAGQTVYYRVALTNTSASALDSITVTDAPVSHLRLDAVGTVSSGSAALADGKVVWKTGSIAAGATVSMWVSGTVLALQASEGASCEVTNTAFDDENSVLVTDIEVGMPFSFTKTDKDGTALAGATFALYACGNAAHTKASDHSERATNDTDCCWKADDTVQTATSGANGKVSFTGLGTGQYMLVETAAPDGYELPHGQWMLDVDVAAQTVTPTARGTAGDLPPAFKYDSATKTYSVANYEKWTMPLAGGTGPIALTATGAALIAAALSWLLLARRKQRTT